MDQMDVAIMEAMDRIPRDATPFMQRAHLLQDIRFFAESEPGDWRGNPEGNDGVMRHVNHYALPGEYWNTLQPSTKRLFLSLIAEEMASDSGP